MRLKSTALYYVYSTKSTSNPPINAGSPIPIGDEFESTTLQYYNNNIWIGLKSNGKDVWTPLYSMSNGVAKSNFKCAQLRNDGHILNCNCGEQKFPPDNSNNPSGVIKTGSRISIYFETTINGRNWLCISQNLDKWIVKYANSNGTGKVYGTVEPKQQNPVKETTASDLSGNTSSDTAVTYYYIGTSWKGNGVSNQISSKQTDYDKAKEIFNREVPKQTTPANYKIFNSSGIQVYPEEARITSDESSYEDENVIDWDDFNWNTASDEYNNSLVDSLTVKNIKGIMGLPYQWMPTQDPRINDGSYGVNAGKPQYIGRTYAEKILSKLPLLMITPGTPDFMADFSSDEGKKLMENLLSKADNDTDKSKLKDFLQGSGKYYSLKFDYADYYKCVNPMCKTAAYFLGIQDKKVNGVKLKNYDYYTDNKSELNKFLGPYSGAIPFYINSETSIQDSFSNDTTQSQLADMVNGYSTMANEINYILGNSKAGAIVDDLKGSLDTSIENISNLTNSMLGGKNLISSIGNGLTAILNGGKLIFPEIWSDASFSRSYDINIKLVTPDNDKLSWFLNIWVPLAHLMCLCLPRQVDVNGYMSPFIVRAFYKGLFNVDMGIITNMSVQKGGDGMWTRDGLPTSVEVSFTIKDLYNYMALSDDPSLLGENIMRNITLLDYIGNSCGVNINEIDIARNLEMYLMVGGVGTVQDKIINGIFTGIDQWFTNKVVSMFGWF